MNNAINDVVYVSFPYIMGGLFGFLGAFSSGLIGEIFGERARQNRHKINVAREVHKLCIEASVSSFCDKPRDIEHVYSVLTDLDGIDEEKGEVLNKLVSLWQLIAFAQQRTKRVTKELRQDQDERMKEIEEKRKILVNWANKIRVGKRFIWF